MKTARQPDQHARTQAFIDQAEAAITDGQALREEIRALCRRLGAIPGSERLIGELVRTGVHLSTHNTRFADAIAAAWCCETPAAPAAPDMPGRVIQLQPPARPA